jgi:hypothetical protein
MTRGHPDVDSTVPRWARALGVVVLVLSLLYALLIEGVMLLWFAVVAGVGALSLFYRLVLAVERLARAADRLTADGEPVRPPSRRDR